MSAAERASRLIPNGAGRKYVAGVPHALLSEAELEAALQGAMLEEREAIARMLDGPAKAMPPDVVDLCRQVGPEDAMRTYASMLQGLIRGRPPP